MPFKSQSAAEKPTKEQALEQVQKLCASEHVQGEKRQDLLRYLVNLELGEKWFTALPKPSGKQTIFEFYKDWNPRHGEKPPTHPDFTEAQSKALVRELARGVEGYYGDPDNAHDRVRIEIQTGKGKSYQPLIRWAAGFPSGEAIAPADTQFEQFFGAGTELCGKKEPRGIVVVQSDSIEWLLEDMEKPRERHDHHKTKNSSIQINIGPLSRLFKARSWVNRWDIEAANELTDCLRSTHITPPKILLVERNSEEILPAEAPYVISLGLGFTGRTEWVLQNCSPWMRATARQDCGDALSIHKELIADLKLEEIFKVVPELPPDDWSEREQGPFQAEFLRLLPSDWGKKYVAQRSKKGGSVVRDYGMILRHTEVRKNRRRALFVVAGFTEFGTFAAANYLAHNWPTLWDTYVREHFQRDVPAWNGPLGDFLVVIEGPSTREQVDWSEGFAITDEILINKGWSRSRQGQWMSRKEQSSS